MWGFLLGLLIDFGPALLALTGTLLATVLDRDEDGKRLSRGEIAGLIVAAVAFSIATASQINARSLRADAETARLDRTTLAAESLVSEMTGLYDFLTLAVFYPEVRDGKTFPFSVEASVTAMHDRIGRHQGHLPPAAVQGAEQMLTKLTILKLMVTDPEISPGGNPRLLLQLFAALLAISDFAEVLGNDLPFIEDNKPLSSTLSRFPSQEDLNQLAPHFPKIEIVLTNHAHEAIFLDSTGTALLLSLSDVRQPDVLAGIPMKVEAQGPAPEIDGSIRLDGSGLHRLHCSIDRSLLLHKYLERGGMTLQLVFGFGEHRVAKNVTLEASELKSPVFMRVTKLDIPTVSSGGVDSR